MSVQVVLFYVYAAIAVIGAVWLVTARKLVHAVLGMFATLCSIAALYLVLGSEFLAAMQLFVYGGAITVLVLFVLMLTKRGAEEQRAEDAGGPDSRWIAGGLCLVLLAVLVYTFAGSEWNLASADPQTTASLAAILFSRYVLPFEIAGLALTIALIGAIVLAREDDLLDAESEPAAMPTAEEPGESPAAEPAAGEGA